MSQTAWGFFNHMRHSIEIDTRNNENKDIIQELENSFSKFIEIWGYLSDK